MQAETSVVRLGDVASVQQRDGVNIFSVLDEVKQAQAVFAETLSARMTLETRIVRVRSSFFCSTMHSQLTEYHTGFREVRDEVAALADGVEDDRLRAAPGPDRWSVAEIYEHMNASGEMLLGTLETAVETGHEQERYGEPPFRYGIISRWWVRVLQPSGWDLPAPSATEPPDSGTLSPTEIIDDFCALQDRFADCVQAAEGLDLRGIRLRSPALPVLWISLGAWFEAHLAHERRHLAQARRTLNDLERV